MCACVCVCVGVCVGVCGVLNIVMTILNSKNSKLGCRVIDRVQIKGLYRVIHTGLLHTNIMQFVGHMTNAIYFGKFMFF